MKLDKNYTESLQNLCGLHGSQIVTPLILKKSLRIVRLDALMLWN